MHKYNLVPNINQIKMFDSYLKCSSIKYGNINQTDLIPLVPLGSKMKDEIAFTKIVYLCISVFNVSASGVGTFEICSIISSVLIMLFQMYPLLMQIH